ncbi:MAG TPA: hypothetical protein VEZ90_05125, partial [Blastocatellia bacterium]|nr:hypothetical protein [Blastocatellia bacterium]
MPLWFKKGEGARKGDPALSIADLAENDSEAVLKKEVAAGTALFKADEDDRTRGWIVMIGRDGSISPYRELTL